MTEQIRNHTEFKVLLTLLKTGETYGYALAKKLKVKQNNLAQILDNLQVKGFVQCRWDTVVGTHPRKMCKLTDKGLIIAYDEVYKIENMMRGIEQ